MVITRRALCVYGTLMCSNHAMPSLRRNAATKCGTQPDVFALIFTANTNLSYYNDNVQ